MITKYEYPIVYQLEGQFFWLDKRAWLYFASPSFKDLLTGLPKISWHLNSNLTLKTLCFSLCFSHSSHLWNNVNDSSCAAHRQHSWQWWKQWRSCWTPNQTNKQPYDTYLIAAFKPEPINLMLSLVLFTLFPSLERRQRRRHGGGGAHAAAAAATMKTTTKLLKTYCSAHFLRLKRIFCVAMNRVE